MRAQIPDARRRAGLAVFAALQALAAFATEAIQLGPAPISNGGYVGRVSSIVCSPTNRRLYFVGGADGGVWRTSDAGRTWSPLTDDMVSTSIGALAMDPANELIVYAGTGESNYANHSRYGLGLYKTIDGGETWVHLAESVFAGRCFSRIVVSHQNSQVLYAAITRAGGFPELVAARGHPQADGPLGVLRSDDGGATWTQLGGGLPTHLSATDLALDPADANILYAAIGRIFGDRDNGIYKTTDGGATWVKLTAGLPSGWRNQGRIALAVAPTMPNRVYALITQKSTDTGGAAATRDAYRSDDGGATWTPLTIGNIQASYGWYLCVVTVHPQDPDIVFMGGVNLHRSTNAGGSWFSVTPPHVDIHALSWDAAGRLVCADDGGFHRSPSLGDLWRTRNDGLGTIQFYAGLSTHPADERVLFGGAQDNGTNRRRTVSLNWQQVFGGDGGWTQVDQAVPERVFVEFQGTGNLQRSENGGDSFVLSSTGINRADRNCFLPPFVIDPSDSNRMLYATHRVYQSTNGGVSWSRISFDLTNGGGAIRALAIAPSDPSVVYAATNDGNVLVSFDGGATFALIRTGNPGWPRVTREMFVDPDDALTMYLAVSAFGVDQVLRTRDAGQTWQTLDGDLPDVPVNVVAVDARLTSPVIYAGTDSGLYRSIDDGQSWRRFGRGLPHAPLIDLLFQPERFRLMIGTQGRGAWRLPVSVPGDLNLDGRIDLTDLALLLVDFGCEGGNCIADIDGDGATGLEDLGVLLAAFGFGN